MRNKCTIIQQRLCIPVHDAVNDLRRRLIDVWAGVEQSVIDDAIDKCHARIQAGRRQFEFSV